MLMYSFFPTHHKVGGYTLQKTTNGSGFAACDKWLGRKIYWDQPKIVLGLFNARWNDADFGLVHTFSAMFKQYTSM